MGETQATLHVFLNTKHLTPWTIVQQSARYSAQEHHCNWYFGSKICTHAIMCLQFGLKVLYTTDGLKLAQKLRYAEGMATARSHVV